MAEDEYIDVRVRLKDARKFMSDTDKVSKGVKGIGTSGVAAGRGLGLASRSVSLFRRGLGAMATTAKIGALALTGGLILALKGSVSAFAESDRVMADQRQALKTTGNAANVTAKQLDAMAKAQSMRTGFDDEAISRSQTLLLTFTKIQNKVGKGNKIFNQAGTAVQDYARRFDKDLNSSAIAVGKALNDPIRGVTALRKVGVSFTKQQQDQIKAMVESGNVMGAQRMILKELQVETGGAAAAYGRTFSGALDRARVMVGNVGERIGGWLAPMIMKGVGFVGRFIASFQKLRDNGMSVSNAIVLSFGRVIGKQAVVMGVWNRAKKIAKGLWDGLKNIALGARDIVAAFLPANKRSDEMGSGLKKVANFATKATQKFRDFGKWLRNGSDGAEEFKAVLAGLLAGFLAYKTVVTIIKAVQMVTKAWTAAQVALNIAMSLNPIGLVIAAIVGIGVAFVLAYKKSDRFRAIINGVWGMLKTLWGWVKAGWSKIKDWLSKPIGWAVKYVQLRIKIMQIAFKLIWGWIKSAWAKVKDWIGKPIGAAVDYIQDRWKLFKLGLKLAWEYVKQAFIKLAVFLFRKRQEIVDKLKGVWDGLKDGFSAVVDWIREKWNALADKLSFGAIKVRGQVIVPEFNLPHLADGGIVRGRGSWVTGEAGPELNTFDGSGVRVQPLTRGASGNSSVVPQSFDLAGSLRDAVGGMAAGGGDIVLNVDGREIARVTAKQVADARARR